MVRRSSAWLALPPLLAACGSVSPLPEDLARRELPVVTLTPADRERMLAFEVEARRALHERRDDDAERDARQALALDPRRARARAALGLSLVHEALRAAPPDLFLQHHGEGELLTASQLDPADPVVALLHARALAGIGHLSAAADVAEACLQRHAASGDEDYLDLLAGAAEWSYELGEERRAIPHLRVLTARRGDDASAWYRLGASLLRIADDPALASEAAAAFQRAAALHQDDEGASLAIVTADARAAELHRAAGQADAAAAALQAAAAAAAAATAAFPGLAEAWFACGVIAEQQDDQKAARDAYEQALRCDGAHLGALLNLAVLLDAAGDARARELWRKALATDDARGVLRAGERSRIEAALAR